MEQKEAEKIVRALFENKHKSLLTFKELSKALGLEPKLAKKYIFRMMKDEILEFYHTNTIYFELKKRD